MVILAVRHHQFILIRYINNKMMAGIQNDLPSILTPIFPFRNELIIQVLILEMIKFITLFYHHSFLQ